MITFGGLIYWLFFNWTKKSVTKEVNQGDKIVRKGGKTRNKTFFRVFSSQTIVKTLVQDISSLLGF